MIYTVAYTKKNSFLRPSGTPPQIFRETQEGEVLPEGKYMPQSIPGTTRVYRPKWVPAKNTFLIEGNQDEINALAASMDLYDGNNKHITEAPLRNENAPFWKHDALSFTISNAGTTLDDEIPLHRFLLACFKADPEFHVGVDKLNPALSAKVKYTVLRAEDKVNQVTKDQDMAMKATELLATMTAEKRTQILASMGARLSDPDPDIVKAILFRKITEEKNVTLPGSTETNLDAFHRLANAPSEELNLRFIISEARATNIILKKTSKYYYGDVVLGRSVEDMFRFLSDDENSDVLNEIIAKLRK